ncbi:hypothetical protein [Arthrobacter sp. D3-16]
MTSNGSNGSNAEPFVVKGLEKLHEEAFGKDGFALGMDEVIDIIVFRTSSTYKRGHMVLKGSVVQRDRNAKYSREALNRWLDACRVRAYKPGLGTWTTAEVHVFPNRPGRLDLFDEEHLARDTDGDWYPGAHPSGAASWSEQLLTFPRTAANIPDWMWDIFRAEGVTPPLYNTEFGSVDWKNKRWPVTENGTDFSAEPKVIDQSQEPGVFAKIGKKLFGS